MSLPPHSEPAFQLTALPSIINERKNHANFQLIIITHDENFLKKLGQGDVMDYYWYAARNFAYAIRLPLASYNPQESLSRFTSKIHHREAEVWLKHP